MTENPVLQRLDALVGEWEIQAIVDGKTVSGGRTTFAWVEEGKFLVQHTDAQPEGDVPPEWVTNSPFPTTTMMGLDDTSETFTMLYADARGVYRVYQMSLDGGIWQIWREAPGFHQRFTGTFSADGDTINARWEGSPDGSTWALDFEMTYARVG
jgi:hypothetical protein